MTEDEMKQFMSDQVKEIEIHKWLEGEKLGKDPGEEAIKEWIKNHAEEFRKKWKEEKLKNDKS